MAKASRRRSSAKRVAAARPRRRRPIGPPVRPTRPAKTYTSKPVGIDFAAPGHRFDGADLEIIGIYHGEASYEGRVFFNNPTADSKTTRTMENGYAGSFYVFGHGGCFGDVGHCEVSGHGDPFDLRYPHPLTPINKRVGVTEALKYFARSNQQVTVTVVPVVTAANSLCDTVNVFRFEQMRLLTYNP